MKRTAMAFISALLVSAALQAGDKPSLPKVDSKLQTVIGRLKWDAPSENQMNWKNAEAYCKKQRKRLPTKTEASASWEDMGIQQRSWIWTSTTDKTDSSKAYVLDIISGDIITDDKNTNDTYYVCCVH